MTHFLHLLLVTAVLSLRAVQKRPKSVLKEAEEESVSFSDQPSVCQPLFSFVQRYAGNNSLVKKKKLKKLQRIIIII